MVFLTASMFPPLDTDSRSLASSRRTDLTFSFGSAKSFERMPKPFSVSASSLPASLSNALLFFEFAEKTCGVRIFFGVLQNILGGFYGFFHAFQFGNQRIFFFFDL